MFLVFLASGPRARGVFLGDFSRNTTARHGGVDTSPKRQFWCCAVSEKRRRDGRRTMLRSRTPHPPNPRFARGGGFRVVHAILPPPLAKGGLGGWESDARVSPPAPTDSEDSPLTALSVLQNSATSKTEYETELNTY